jgi:uncharacterized protein (TIGR03435 family)
MTGQPIANMLTLSGARAAVGGIVLDRTSLTGAFDIDIDFVPQSVLMAAGRTPPNGPSLMTAVQDQLWLRFERRQEVVDVLVIDHVEMPLPD